MPDASEGGALAEIRLWDPVTRLLHWALAVAVATAWGLGEWGPAIMTLHFWAGYAVLALLALRLVWGLLGPRPVRVTALLASPRRVADYVRSELFRRGPSRWPGHTPLSAWAVLAIWGLLAAQALTGLASDPEDYVNVGPLAGYVGIDRARTATAWHATLSGWVAAIVALHLAAIAWYRLWKREDLVGSMIHGRKRVR